MAGYRIWGCVQQIGPREYVAIASLVSVEGAKGAAVEAVKAESHEAAAIELDRLTTMLGAQARERGDTVVNVEREQ